LESDGVVRKERCGSMSTLGGKEVAGGKKLERGREHGQGVSSKHSPAREARTNRKRVEKTCDNITKGGIGTKKSTGSKKQKEGNEEKKK